MEGSMARIVHMGIALNRVRAMPGICDGCLRGVRKIAGGSGGQEVMFAFSLKMSGSFPVRRAAGYGGNACCNSPSHRCNPVSDPRRSSHCEPARSNSRPFRPRLPPGQNRRRSYSEALSLPSLSCRGQRMLSAVRTVSVWVLSLFMIFSQATYFFVEAL